jgi:uncharacterized RDD family membrane protein YckC
MQYAGFWRRFVAMIIDTILSAILAGVACVLIGLIVFAAGRAAGATDERVMGAATIAVMTVGIPFYYLYHAVFESSERGATPGKMALGIAVTDVEGGRIGFGRAFARNVAKWVSCMILMIGFLMAAFTSRKQALHDLMTGCLVVRR